MVTRNREKRLLRHKVKVTSTTRTKRTRTRALHPRQVIVRVAAVCVAASSQFAFVFGQPPNDLVTGGEGVGSTDLRLKVAQPPLFGSLLFLYLPRLDCL